MTEFLTAVVILLYLAIGIAFSIGADYPALVIIFWPPLLVIESVNETFEFVKDRFEEIGEWLEDKAKKMGGK